jgi:methylmalonyl-CoA/ethylmalonyl-CoA epimerase
MRRIDHVAMAVPSIAQFREDASVMLGELRASPVYENRTQRVREQFLDDGHTRIELLEPLDTTSPISAFLDRNPAGGLLHLALQVTDIRDSIARIEAAGGCLVSGPVPDVAFAGRQIAFVLVAGQLMELIEQPS